MFNNFLNFFKTHKNINYSGEAYYDFISQLGGMSFGDGIFNSFGSENIGRWNNIVGEAFPNFKNQFMLFGYDWLGDCFAIDLRKGSTGNVLLFEIGTDEVLEIPIKFIEFLNREIPINTEECLVKSFFEEWKRVAIEPLKYGRCAGYRVPLFLGGEDDIDNLEEIDMEIYWSVITQIKNQI